MAETTPNPTTSADSLEDSGATRATIPERKKPTPKRRTWFAIGAMTVAALWAAREGYVIAHPDPFDHATFLQTTGNVLKGPDSGEPVSAAVAIEFDSRAPVAADEIARVTENRIENGGIVGLTESGGFTAGKATCSWPSDTDKKAVRHLILECTYSFEPVGSKDSSN